MLVRYNPEGQADLNRRQLSRLRRLSDWLHEHGRSFLFELLVPPEHAQMERVGGSRDRYDREIRPDLVVRTIAEAQTAGVEPDIWKIEGLERREDCVRVVQAARAGGRDRVACIVLGRGDRDDHTFLGYKPLGTHPSARVRLPSQLLPHRFGRASSEYEGAPGTEVGRGTGHYLNRSAEFETSVLGVIRAYTPSTGQIS